MRRHRNSEVAHYSRRNPPVNPGFRWQPRIPRHPQGQPIARMFYLWSCHETIAAAHGPNLL